MTPTSLNEASLEFLIMSDLTGVPVERLRQGSAINDLPAVYDAEWIPGLSLDFDRAHVVDTRQLFIFLQRTQPKIVEELGIGSSGAARTNFLNRLQGEVTRRGVVDVLRNGIKHLIPETIRLYFPTPTPGNPTAAQRYRANIFSVTRQLRYSLDETQRSLDLALFINGLPFATMELKNAITNQTVQDAIVQYRRDRSPKEKLFQFGVCAVHFAVDDSEVWFTTKLDDANTQFLPFNKGYNDGAGNPPNPNGIKTDYLWKVVLSRDNTANLIENYIQLVEEKRDNGRKSRKLIFPRYHQLDVVEKLLADATRNGVGQRYLIQHSAGSGKSNSIAWLAHQLIELKQDNKPIFDTVLIVTDRRALDTQLSATVRQMGASGWTTKRAENSSELGELIRKGQRIILTTVQKFAYITNSIGNDHRERSFGIIIDEAHSSQGGRAAGQLNATLAKKLEIDPDTEELSFEDQLLIQMRGRKMLDNASYFAFTATPKNKTLEMFGERYDDNGQIKRRPFHTYTMKQAIDEKFILDVLQNYTPYLSYYRLIKTVEDDPEFDRKRAKRKLHHYVESHEATVRQKAAIIVEHFHEHVLKPRKIGGEARAMVVTDSIARAIDYYTAINAELAERRSPCKAIAAFSVDQEIDGEKVTESSLNGFPGSQIPDRFREDPYRFLVVADKFQTGYDEPLLHTMYVDKRLTSVKAVQTLSRLNRAHPAKNDTFILDFFNTPDDIIDAFQPFYRTTLLSGVTDPNKLHDLKAMLDGKGVYAWSEVTAFVQQYLAGASREQLDPVLDLCRDRYESDAFDNDDRIEFKGNAKAFVRSYNFLSSIIPYNNTEWEQLSIFLRFLTPKLPAPDDPDLAKGILEAIDMESYRVEARQTIALTLEDDDGEIAPSPTGQGGFQPEPELDRLSSILESFNDMFADANFSDEDRIQALDNIRGPIMQMLAGDDLLEATLRNSDTQNTMVRFRDVFEKALISNISNNTKMFTTKQDNPSFEQQLESMVFELYKTHMLGGKS